MKTKISEELKADLPSNQWGKILGATPVIMTVIATLLAGLASSEMTKAQYDRSMAAQLQSKAGDQWSYFQAKKLRGALQRNSLDLLHSLAVEHPLQPTDLGSATDDVKKALLAGELPVLPASPAIDENLKAASDAFEAGKSDAELNVLLAKVKDSTLADALRAARDRADAFDNALAPVLKGIDQIERAHAETDPESIRSLTAARLRFVANRYDTEARLNQDIAGIYELQVRKDNFSAERHHRRSGQFFYGMLAAQMGVIVSTLAIAARKRNLLWSLAAAAGLIAVAFAIYVYLRV